MKGPSNDADAVRPAERTATCFRPRPPDSRGSEERLETAERYESNFRTAPGNGRERSRSKYRRNSSGPPSKANARKNTKQLPNERQNARNRERIGTAPTGRPPQTVRPVSEGDGSRETEPKRATSTAASRFAGSTVPIRRAARCFGRCLREGIRTHGTEAVTGQHPRWGGTRVRNARRHRSTRDGTVRYG